MTNFQTSLLTWDLYSVNMQIHIEKSNFSMRLTSMGIYEPKSPNAHERMMPLAKSKVYL